MIKVLIADDSFLVRRVIADLLGESGDIEVVGLAGDGTEAVGLTLALRPDLVIMDLVMPQMDGLAAIEEIMAAAPTPVLVLSAAVDASEVYRAFNAIKRGALDVMEKPQVDDEAALAAFALRLEEKVRLLSGIRVIRHPRRRCRELPQRAAAGSLSPTILAVGASTGGPKAVMRLLKALPADFPGTVFVVQHIAEGFAAGLASWLDRECALAVRLAADGERYGAGEAVIAPGSSHLTLQDGRVRLVDLPPVNCCRPSIDVFFDSLAQEPCDRVVGVLLTGMGKDGAQGLLRIRERGGTTLAQDEPSCAIFGMPREAIRLNAVDQVLPLDCIPDAVMRLFAPR